MKAHYWLAVPMLPILLAPAQAVAAQPTVTLQNRVLTVTGTAAANEITIERSGRSVAVSVDSEVVAKVKIRRLNTIRLAGGRGDDRFVVAAADTGRKVVLEGNRGNDRYVIDGDGVSTVAIREDRRGGGRGDLIDLSATSAPITLDMDRKLSQSVTATRNLVVSPGVDNVLGGSGDDTLTGRLVGKRLRGGPGDDRLVTRAQGILAGGPGDDSYVFTAASRGFTRLVELPGEGEDLVDFSAVEPTADPNDDDLFFDLGAGGFQRGTFEADLNRDDTFEMVGGTDGEDFLMSAGVDNRLIGGTGDDHYWVDADEGGTVIISELPGAGKDWIDFRETSTPLTVDIGATSLQAVTATKGLHLSHHAAIDDVDGGTGDSTITGNVLVNRIAVNDGSQDTVVHRGAGQGIDILSRFNPADGDQVRFATGGALSAADLTIANTAGSVLDAATESFGVAGEFQDFLNGSSFYIAGTTDTTPPGQLITFNGAGGFGLGSNVDSVIASYASNGASIGGAGARDRIIDYSLNGNSLIGRDGSDTLIAGAGNDILQGDRGFAPGVADTLTGGPGFDTFVFGEAFGGGSIESFGNDTVTDFVAGVDTIDLYTGVSVRSGLGTTSVVVWDGATDLGTITSTNGHVWLPASFS